MILIIMSMGWTKSQNCGHQQACCSYLRWYTSTQDHCGMISTRETPDSSTRALWQSYQQSNSKNEGNDEFCLTKYLFHTSSGSLTCRKILHGADGFTSPPKKVLICITLKNPSPSARFEPANYDKWRDKLVKRQNKKKRQPRHSPN
jgi:hypothetical protein